MHVRKQAVIFSAVAKAVNLGARQIRQFAENVANLSVVAGKVVGQ